jgi:transcriptional regulator with XRE-family HTH domain
MSNLLKPEQYEAIKYLAQPKRGGLTQQQIADKVGTTRNSLYRWRQDVNFTDELKREISRNTMQHIPDILDSLIKQATKETQPSTKAAELVLKTVSMLNDRLEIEDRSKAQTVPTNDIEHMKAEIERMRNQRKV